MDDVHYLKSKGVISEQSYTFFVDSSMRDKDAHPTPSDYVIQFKNPIKNCFSISLLDASVPRTEYTVEDSTNTLVYTTDACCSYAEAIANGTAVEVKVAPGDYNLPQLVQALNDALAGRSTPEVQVEMVTNPPEVSSQIRFVRAAPFSLLMGASSMRFVLGFGNSAVAPGDSQGFYGPRFSRESMCYGADSNDAFMSVPQAVAGEDFALVGPMPVPLPEYTENVNPIRKVRQVFTATASGTLARVVFSGTTTIQGSLRVRLSRLDTSEIIIGDTTVEVLPAQDQWDVAVPDGGMVTAGQVYAVEFSAVSGSDRFDVYRSELSTETTDTIQVYTNSWTAVEPSMALCCDVVVQYSTHAVESPGPVNLTGARFVLVRCPDIESQISRDRAFEPTSSGLGLCKLSGSGYRDMRFDFSSFQQRTFHPVHVSYIRIRLEKSNGELYNAHGVDHTLMFCLKFYGGSGLPNGSRTSVLNPKYTPDLRQQLLDKWQTELEG